MENPSVSEVVPGKPLFVSERAYTVVYLLSYAKFIEIEKQLSTDAREIISSFDDELLTVTLPGKFVLCKCEIYDGRCIRCWDRKVTVEIDVEALAGDEKILWAAIQADTDTNNQSIGNE